MGLLDQVEDEQSADDRNGPIRRQNSKPSSAPSHGFCELLGPSFGLQSPVLDRDRQAGPSKAPGEQRRRYAYFMKYLQPRLSSHAIPSWTRKPTTRTKRSELGDWSFQSNWELQLMKKLQQLAIVWNKAMTSAMPKQ